MGLTYFSPPAGFFLIVADRITPQGELTQMK